MKRRLRLVIVSLVYSPSHDAISQLLEDLAGELAKSGMEVHVLTSAVNYMTGEALPRHETKDGVRIWRLPNLNFDKRKNHQRFFSYGAFIALSGAAMNLIPKPDVIVYLSTPPFLAWSSGLAKRFFDAKTIFIAQDVYPEILAYTEKKINGFAMAGLSILDKKVLRNMDRVIVLGEKMKEILEKKGVNSNKVSIIENWSIAAESKSFHRQNNPLLNQLGLEKKFVVQYSGNMGIVHDMESIAEAASNLRNRPNIQFLFIGDGKRKRTLTKIHNQADIKNTHFLPYQSIDQLHISLSACDVSLISLRPEMEGLVVPSKLYGILASGRPVINIGSKTGEIAAIVARAGCGLTVQNGEELTKAITYLEKNVDERISMGKKSRRFFEENFGRQLSIEKYRRVIEQLVP